MLFKTTQSPTILNPVHKELKIHYNQSTLVRFERLEGRSVLFLAPLKTPTQKQERARASRLEWWCSLTRPRRPALCVGKFARAPWSWTLTTKKSMMLGRLARSYFAAARTKVNLRERAIHFIARKRRVCIMRFALFVWRERVSAEAAKVTHSRPTQGLQARCTCRRTLSSV